MSLDNPARDLPCGGDMAEGLASNRLLPARPPSIGRQPWNEC